MMIPSTFTEFRKDKTSINGSISLFFNQYIKGNINFDIFFVCLANCKLQHGPCKIAGPAPGIKLGKPHIDGISPTVQCCIKGLCISHRRQQFGLSLNQSNIYNPTKLKGGHKSRLLK